MEKRLYFIETNGGYVIASVDSNKKCRYLVDNNDCCIPYLGHFDEDERWKVAVDFLNSIKDDSSWNDNLTYDELFDEDNMWAYTNPDGAVIIAEINKEL